MFLVPTICTSVDFSPTSEFLATTHVNSVAIYLWTNTTLLAPVTLKPLDADKSEMIDSEMPLIGGGSEEQNENDEDTESDEVLYFGKLKLADGLVTLTSEPHSKWHNLLHLDTIKKRNKPKEPPKAPEEAPFFLSTVPGLEPKFQVPEKAQADETNSSKIMNFEQFGSIETDFQIKLRRAVELNNQREFFGFLKSLGISTVDLEIQSIGLSQNTNDLANFLRILDWSLSEKLDYEFVQSLLARVLKVHSDLIYSNMDVFEPILESLESKHESTWSKIDDLFNNTMCAINFLR
jgi:U3 small nucleolar RNA-associated protein 21